MTAKNSSPCWLFLGPEIGLKQEEIQKIRTSLAAKGGNLEENSWYAGETAVQDMVSAMRNGSLFADIRLFFIKSAENISKKEDIDLLASYMAAPQTDTALIFTSDETSIAKGLEKAAPAGAKKVFYELLENDKKAWVGNFFRRQSYRINSEGIQTILELVENNTEALKRDCNRLILFLDKDREIGAAEVEKWLSHTREESAFTLFSRIASGDFSRSLESLRTLLRAKEPPPAILAGLTWCFKQLRSYRFLTSEGINSDEALIRVNIRAPQARKDYTEAGRRYTLEAAETCLSLTAGYDILVRSAGTFPQEILMDEYLYKIHCLAK